jgi:hypothetical protein
MGGAGGGRLSFGQWADDWWEVWAADPDRSPTTLAATENRLRRHVRPWFGDRPIERIGPADVRRWQAQLAAMVGRESLLACRSILHRILRRGRGRHRKQPGAQGATAQAAR